MEHGVSFALLGPVRAWRDGVELSLGAPQQRATLAFLLLREGRPATIDDIGTAFWGEVVPPSASATIRTYLYRLRRALAAAGAQEVIVRDGGGYRTVVDPQTVDIGRFGHEVALAHAALSDGRAEDATGHLRGALALHRGVPLARTPGAFVDFERSRLLQQRLGALETMFRLELDRGAHAETLGQLEVAVADEPLREPLRELLILALYRSGRQAEALLAYENTRRVLRDELGTTPGPPLRELHQRLLRSDPELLIVGRTTPTAVSLPIKPAQLPADLPVFVGRAAELAEAGAALPPDGTPPERTTVTVIGGMAGVGKTAFAVRWAHGIADRFPDGQLYVNLRGFEHDAAAVDPQDVVRGFLQAFGVAVHRIPPDNDAQMALYRSLMADRRCLIVLDNARDTAQVLPLLPGRSCSLVVVTGRTRLDGLVVATGAQTVTLDLLDNAAARELLARRVGTARVEAEPEAVRALIDRCARLPLALSIVSARISAEPATFPLADIADELFDTQQTLDAFTATDWSVDVRAVLASSYAALTVEAARVFRLLAVHPGTDASVSAAASLAGVEVRVVRALLRELTDAQLITQPYPNRFSWHDLLRAYAEERLNQYESSVEREEAFRRLADHYVHTADLAARLASAQADLPDLPERADGVTRADLTEQKHAIRWFLAEQAVTVPLLELMAAHGLHAHVWRFAWAPRHFLDRRGHWNELAVAHRIALRSATAISDDTGLAYAHRGLARAEFRMGLYDAAWDNLKAALTLFGRRGEVTATAYTLRQSATLAALQGDPEHALVQASRSRDLFRVTGGVAGEAMATSAIGRCCAALGRFDEAIAHCRTALGLFETLGHQFDEAFAWESLATSQHHLGQFEEAVTSYQRAVEIYRTFRACSDVVDTLVRLSDAHLALKQQRQAGYVLREAAEIRDSLEPVREPVTRSGSAVKHPAAGENADRARGTAPRFPVRGAKDIRLAVPAVRSDGSGLVQ